MTPRQQNVPYVTRRLDILSDIKNLLRKLQAGEAVAKPIINLSGITGIGKTFVLQQLFDECRRDYDVLWLDFNLKDARRADEETAYCLDLKRGSWTRAHTLLNSQPDLQGRIERQISFDGQNSQPVNKMGDILFAQALKRKPGRPLLLLLDSLDNLPYWKWLQEQIVKPLVELQHTVIICASRTELYWHYWEIREYCQTHEMAGFALEETRQFLDRYHGKLLAETVHTLTGGYPLVLDQFSKIFTAPQFRPLMFRHFTGFLDAPARFSIQAIDEAAEALSEDTRYILRHVGILRRAQVFVMQQLLESISKQSWESQAQHRRLTMALREMREQGLIEPGLDTFERLVPEARRAVQQKMAPAEYLGYCDIIAQAYYDRAYKHPKREAYALAEWLFFSAECLAHTGGDEARAQWQDKLAALLARMRHVTVAEQAVRELVGGRSDRNQTGVGGQVAAWLYTDGELLQKLSDLGLLEHLEKELQPLLLGEVPIRHDLRRACSDVIEELGKRIEAVGQPRIASFETMLRSLLKANPSGEFDQATLRDRLRDIWKSLQQRSVRSVNEVIVILHSSGILLLDRERRIYRVNPAIVRLLSITPPHKQSDDGSPVGYVERAASQR